ncbi:holo-ACP synthase [Bacillus sp. FSL K6-3431]|uniref:holo-ACP synthase n=1 Tax=Bacillus sp. FSL K6-3431 TaxID=2921500 RepID=UPI0030FD12BA
MIIGIGLDLVETDRIDRLRKRQKRFAERILTEVELSVYDSLNENRKTEFLSGRFAAKEAYSKAAGTGIGEALSFQDIEIMSDEKGKPCIVKPARYRIHLSITHTKSHAAAQVIIETSR